MDQLAGIRSAFQTVTSTNETGILTDGGATAQCPSNTVIVSGGCSNDALNAVLTKSYPSSNSWECYFTNKTYTTAKLGALTAYAICL